MLPAGDYVAPFVLPHFKQLKADLIGVFGNNDGEQEGLKKQFERLGVHLRGSFATVITRELKIILLHGQ